MVRANALPGTPFRRIYHVSLKVLLVFVALCSLALFVLNTITTHKLRKCADFDSKTSSGDCIHSSWAPYVALAVTAFLSATSAFAILIYDFHLPEEARARMPCNTFRVVTFVVIISLPAFVFGWKNEGIFLKHVQPETSSMTRATLIFNHINLFVGVLVALGALILALLSQDLQQQVGNEQQVENEWQVENDRQVENEQQVENDKSQPVTRSPSQLSHLAGDVSMAA